jgi:hypothetical protein
LCGTNAAHALAMLRTGNEMNKFHPRHEGLRIGDLGDFRSIFCEMQTAYEQFPEQLRTSLTTVQIYGCEPFIIFARISFQ